LDLFKFERTANAEDVVRFTTAAAARRLRESTILGLAQSIREYEATLFDGSGM